MSTELETTPDEQQLAKLEQAEAALAATQPDEDDFILPRLKLTQQLTREVVDGDVDSGVWLNSVTGEEYGDEVEAVIVHRFKGRLYSDDDEGVTYVASGPVAPDNWPEEFRGKAFVDIPEAEEQHKAKANAEGGSWGRGPAIQTTYNYVGFLTADPDMPVRITLKSTAAKVAKKWNLLLRRRASSSSVYTLAAEKRESKGKPYFAPTVRVARQSTVEERIQAVRLGELVQQNKDLVEGRFADTADEHKPEKPNVPEDSLDV
jgi:hypothetical protein